MGRQVTVLEVSVETEVSYTFSCIDGCTFFLRREINCFLDRSPLAGGTRLAVVKMINYGPSVV